MRNQLSYRSILNWPAAFLWLVLLASPVATWAQAPGSAVSTSTQALHNVIPTSTQAPDKGIPPWGRAAGAGIPTHPETKQTANRRKEAGRTEVRMGVSWFDLEGDRSSTALEFSFRPTLELPLDARLQFGAMGNGDGAFYAYGGITRALHLGEFRLSPSISVGLYQRGESLDLGSPLEFRSGLLLDRRVLREHRLGLFVYHLSNAGLADRNPGVEILGVGYVIPW